MVGEGGCGCLIEAEARPPQMSSQVPQLKEEGRQLKW
uniref:Uncharacterized protein n=1 Tax=Manihot esculenta TaxID=3983 RepID=A0A2C9WKC6_MANES